MDEDWLNLVVLDVEEAIKETTLAQAPLIVVSALTGEGLPDLVSAIDHLLESAPAGMRPWNSGMEIIPGLMDLVSSGQ